MKAIVCKIKRGHCKGPIVVSQFDVGPRDGGPHVTLNARVGGFATVFGAKKRREILIAMDDALAIKVAKAILRQVA